MKRFCFRKKFWKKGSSELVSFVCIIPMLVGMLISIIAAAQISCVSQALEAAAYSAGRVAVVTDDFDAAKENALEMAKEIVLPSAGNIVADSLEVELTPIAAATPEAEWVKGNLVRVSVDVYVNTVLPFDSKVRSREVIMMIERPAATNTFDISGGGETNNEEAH